MKRLILFGYLLFGATEIALTQNLIADNLCFMSFTGKSNRDSDKKDVNILLYSIINKNGLITVLNNDKYHNTLRFYSYQLDKNEVALINSIFNGKKLLRSYIAKDHLGSDELFAGNYRYLSVTYKGNNKEDLCFIEPFLSSQFLAVINRLDDIVFNTENKNKISAFKIPENIRISLIKCYKRSKLPKTKVPNSFSKNN